MTTEMQENPEVRELLDRGLKLPPQDRESLAHDLLNSLEMEPSMETILRRSDEIASGQAVLLTREEAAAEVRARMLELGVEL